MAKRINPSKSTPQAPRKLRVGSKGHARALAAKAAGEPAPAAEEDYDEDKDPDDDDEEEKAAHEALRADAEAAHSEAADAYKAAKGTDSASALMAAEDAGDKAADAHAKCKASSMALRGAEPDSDSARPGAPPPAPAQARALTSLAGPHATAQLELAQLAAFGRDALALLGAKSAAAGSMKLRLAVDAFAKIGKVEATAKAQAHFSRLAVAVQAGMPRAEAFDLDEENNPIRPKAVWSKLELDELDEILELRGFSAGASASRAFGLRKNTAGRSPV